MKILFSFFVSAFLVFLPPLVLAKTITCAKEKSFYKMTFTLPDNGITGDYQAQLFHYDTLTQKMKLDEPAQCEKNPIMNGNSVISEFLTRCWVLYGPDGGQSILLKSEKTLAGKYQAVLTAQGPTGSGVSEDFLCE